MEHLPLEQLPLLLVLLLAHFLGDFALQPQRMAVAKTHSVVNKALLLHVGVHAGLLLALLGFHWLVVVAALLHGVIDMGKSALTQLEKRRHHPWLQPLNLFLWDQVAHVISLYLLWRLGTHLGLHSWATQMGLPLLAVVLGYVVVLWPAKITIKMVLQACLPSTLEPAAAGQVRPSYSTGAMIGYIERSLVLMLCLAGQFMAVGFLFAGKGILRLNSKVESEYVVLGNLLSFGISIMVGFGLRWLLGLGVD